MIRYNQACVSEISEYVHDLEKGTTVAKNYLPKLLHADMYPTRQYAHEIHQTEQDTHWPTEHKDGDSRPTNIIVYNRTKKT